MGTTSHPRVDPATVAPGGSWPQQPASTDAPSDLQALAAAQAAQLLALRSAGERAALASRAVGIGTWELQVSNGESLWDEQMWLLRGLAPRPGAPSVDAMLALLLPEDRERVRLELGRAHAEDRPSQYEFRVVLPDGSVRWLASRSALIRDGSGRSLRRIGVNWDITEARTAEAVRQESALAVRESRAKSELLARISHELRTPLNAILGFNQLLLEEGDRATPQVRRLHLEHIRQAGEHLLNLVNDVLELSRADAAEMPAALTAVDLRLLLDETLPLVEQQAGVKQVQLTADAADLRVAADPTLLKQVLLNLLTNAIKYNRPGGRVSIEARPLGRRVRLTVQDNGIGMTPEQLGQVFEPFKRLLTQRDDVEGVGIGLTIVKTLVERMGGEVGVRSQPGAGSVFEVRLGAAFDAQAPEDAQAETASPSPTAAEPAPEETPRAAPSDRRWRLLYVEDNPVNVLIVSELLARRGDFHFDSAPDGLSGVAQAQKLQPDLVLLDMHLPDIDGREVLRRLRADAVTAPIPCIALSANAMPDDIRSALEEGFAAYWTKPLDFKLFNRALDTMFGPAAPR